MTPRHPRPLAVLLSVVLATPAVLAGQDDFDEPRRDVGVSLTPYVGFHHPFGTLLTDDDPEGGWRARTGLLLGARIDFPLRSRTTLQVDIGYATPPIRGFGDGYQGFEAEGRFVTYTARLTYALTGVRRGRAPRPGVTVHGGAGFMQHWVASPRPNDRTWPTAVGGATLRLPLTARIMTFLTGELLIYRATFPGETTNRSMQQDLRVSLGAWLPG